MVEEALREAKRALEAAGFMISEGWVRGFSGYLHHFDFAAEREGRRLYVSVVSNTLALLMECAKSLDVDGEVFAVALGEMPVALPESRRFKFVAAASFKELHERLLETLSQQKK